MAKDAILQGDYTDLKFIKSRKVAVISIEIPIEAATSFVAAFGTPSPATGVPVAIARLQEPAKQEAEKPKRSWGQLSRAEQAGIACNEPEFRAFLSSRNGSIAVVDGMDAAGYVRRFCRVKSRADLDVDQMAAASWDNLYSGFQRWKMGAAA